MPTCYLRVQPCTSDYFMLLILKGLVALTGIELVFKP